jgi:hypothetical protein
METTVAKPLLTRLKGMIGKTFLYKKNQITICNYHVLAAAGETQIDIEDEYGKPAEPIRMKDLSKFLDGCLPVDAQEVIDNAGQAVSTQVVQQTNGLLNTLQQTLLDNINQVKSNPGYIKQANVINSSVNSLIGLAKIQIQVNKMGKGK